MHTAPARFDVYIVDEKLEIIEAETTTAVSTTTGASETADVVVAKEAPAIPPAYCGRLSRCVNRHQDD